MSGQVDRLARRADALIAGVRAALGRGSQRQARHPAHGARRAEPPGLSAEIRANIEGPALGRRFGRDAFAAAAALGYTVELVPAVLLQNASRPGVEIRGRLVGKLIQVADHLAGRPLQFTVAHELAHGILGPAASESDCNDFSRRLLAASLPESRGETWARWQRQALDRQRRMAAAAARRRGSC